MFNTENSLLAKYLQVMVHDCALGDETGCVYKSMCSCEII